MSEIFFCNTDVKEIENTIITAYEHIAERTLYPADPIRIFLQTLAYEIARLRTVIDETGKQNLLRYAEGAFLDALGELTGTYRIPASYASVLVRFTRAIGSTQDIFIRKGLKITPDGKIYFTTDINSIIPQGSDFVDVRCTALTNGAIGNGFKPGTINKLVDTVEYLSSVTNITESEGGRDAEGDNEYRERIYLAPERFSTAGPTLAYEYHAKSAYSGIADVAVLSDTPGTVQIYPLLEGGELPGEEILERVFNAVNGEKTRPFTDYVTVLTPEVVNYDINITYYLYKNKNITAEDVTTAVNDYILWQKSKLGKDINPDVLRQRLLEAGVKRVVVTEPNFTLLSFKETAYCENVSINYGGSEDE